VTALRDCTDPATWWPHVDEATKALAVGGLVVLPTDTVYGIAADAFKPEAVQALLEAKGRGRDMPPPVLIGDVRTMDGLADNIPDAVRELVTQHWPGPLTIILQAQRSLQWDLGETRGTVALRMPDHELTLAVLRRTGPLAVSSANTSGSPAATTAAEAASMLGGSVRVYLDGGTSPGGVASTIVDATGPELRIVREGGLSAEDLGIGAAPQAAPDAPEETVEEPSKPVRKPRTRKPRAAVVGDGPVVQDSPVVEDVPVVVDAVVVEDAVEPAAVRPGEPVEAPSKPVRKPRTRTPKAAVGKDSPPVEAAVAVEDAAEPAAVQPVEEPSKPVRKPRTRTPKPVLQETPDAPAEPPAETPEP